MSTVIAKHSPLGGSGAERWLNCPGSNVILQILNLPESDETEFARDGLDAHDAAAYCLRKGLDAFEIIGPFDMGERPKFAVTKEMATTIQVYLDYVRAIRKEAGASLLNSCVEERITANFHPLYKGTIDAWEYASPEPGTGILDIIDFKYGEGIAVDAKKNAQLLYYAVGLLEKLMPTVIRMHIVQPRAYHPDGPLRDDEISVEELRQWRDEILIPGMKRAEIDHTLKPGEHCRFCPAKLACPLLTALFGASVKADASVLANYSDAGIARNLRLVGPVRMYLKALEEEAFKRASAGKTIDDESGDEEGKFKLVYKKADRVTSAEGQNILKLCAEGLNDTFGQEEVLMKPEIKSPAQIDALGPRGKAFTSRYCYTPQTGLTIVPGTDKRIGVTVRSLGERFHGVVEQAKAQNQEIENV